MIGEVLLAMVEPETAGDPMSEPKWVRRSLCSLRPRLHHAGHPASAPTVSRLLKKHDDALHVNAKEKDASAQPPDRDIPCRYIATHQQTLRASGAPIISVDTKKKARRGNFKNAGQAWCQAADAVNVHDLLSDALGRGAP